MGGAHPLARAVAALVGLAATVIPLLLALGVISPIGDKDALTESRARTLEAGSSKIRIDVDAGARTTEYTATGTFDYREDRGTFRYNLTRNPAFEAVAAGEIRFFQNVAFTDMLAGSPRPWVLIDLEDDPALAANTAKECKGGGLDVGPVAEIRIEDPTRVLAALAASAELADLGTDREFGVELHKYRGTLRATGARGRVTATAWIDDDDLVRRIQLAAAGGASTTTMTFYDFGAPVDTAPPPAAEVVPLADILKAKFRECNLRQ
ncbi:MAG TPA: hypothetical protein VG318_12860 [Actinomycetota bacterium]|nr:hypothetical protein [Actinomycetota bacterium]